MTPVAERTPDPMISAKFVHPDVTARGETRAKVQLHALETLWFNTGTLCNLSCANCYIESTPRNDRLVYLSRHEVVEYLDEIFGSKLPTKLIGLTGGEPFMNPEISEIAEECLSRGFDLLILTNAMKPMQKVRERLDALRRRFGNKLTIRVSLDHYAAPVHDLERGNGSWASSIDGLLWLSHSGFNVHVASRHLSGEPEAELRAGFERLFRQLGIAIDHTDPVRLMVFPEMVSSFDPPEITDKCWSILGISPTNVMCSSARMVVKPKGSTAPTVVACTLLPYDDRFKLGRTLADASRAVPLNHPVNRHGIRTPF